jgi:hypothetical protein
MCVRLFLAAILVIPAASAAMLTPAVAAGSGVSPAACTKTWSGPRVNGHWEDPQSWTPAGVPGADDQVCIRADLTLAAGTDAAIARLRFDGILGVAGHLSISTSLVNAGGIEVGAGASIAVAADIANTGLIQVYEAGSLHAASLVQDAGVLEGPGRIIVGRAATAVPGPVAVHAGGVYFNAPATWVGEVLVGGGTGYLSVTYPYGACRGSLLTGDYTLTSTAATGLVVPATSYSGCTLLHVTGLVTVAGTLQLPSPTNVAAGSRFVLFRADGGLYGRFTGSIRAGWRVLYTATTATAIRVD